MIELSQIRYFLAAVEHGSFRKAASGLGIQESTISRRIRDLEDQLGASLFIRHNGGVRLTVAGQRCGPIVPARGKNHDDIAARPAFDCRSPRRWLAPRISANDDSITAVA
jgi:DNA-binding transcriptional LysR family regulator